jgi:ParB family transcriptional regulator, chromosome partitioning protein
MEDAKKTRGLGKGLSELLGEARAKATVAKQGKSENINNTQRTLSQELDSLNNLSRLVDDIHAKSDTLQSENILNTHTINTHITDSAYSGSAGVDNLDNDDDAFETIISNEHNDIKPLPKNASDFIKNTQELFKEDVSHLSILHNLEIKQPEIKQPEIKQPEIKQPEIKQPDNTIQNQQHTHFDNNHSSIIHKLPIELVNPNKEQPRKFFDVNALNDLAASIKVYGIIQPILVNKLGNEYMIVAGERRWRASQIAGLTVIPAIIANYQEDETLEIALIENIQRANLTPIDEAKAYYYLIHKYELTQNELAQKVGKSRSYVANMVRLLELEDNVKNYLESGELSVGHARVLIGVKNAADLADKIVKSNMSVRKVEELVSQSSQKQNVRLPKALDTGKNTDILGLEADLRAALGVSVSINSQSPQKGNLVIRYESLEQLDEVCRRLCSNWGVDVA